jgi:biopolymer transport protein ExbD
MGEVSQSGGDHGGKKGKPKGKKSSTHIDMTPMVDLAFLLLTFFMLTATFSKPKVMEIVLPDKSKKTPPVDIKETRIMNVLLDKNDKIYYYIGKDLNALQATTYQAIRPVLQDRERNDSTSIVLIKPGEGSKYKNVVDMFDEMNITRQKIFALVDITKPEQDKLKAQ